jgi:hypothetical protein
LLKLQQVFSFAEQSVISFSGKSSDQSASTLELVNEIENGFVVRIVRIRPD